MKFQDYSPQEMLEIICAGAELEHCQTLQEIKEAIRLGDGLQAREKLLLLSFEGFTLWHDKCEILANHY